MRLRQSLDEGVRAIRIDDDDTITIDILFLNPVIMIAVVRDLDKSGQLAQVIETLFPIKW